MRVAVPSDAEQIAELESLLFPNSMGERMVRQELQLGKGWVHELPRFDDDVVVGYALIRFDEDVVDLTRLGVHPEVRGQEIGSSLLQKVLEESDTVILTVQKDNVRALKLYFKHGFEIVGHLQSAFAWVMRRAKTR